MVRIADGTGTTAAAPADQLRVSIRTADGERPIADLPGWELERSAGPWDGPGTRARLCARWRGAEPIRAGLVVRRPLAGPTRPHILIPAVFYGDNGPGGALDREAFAGPGRDFAAERAALPAVFAAGERAVA